MSTELQTTPLNVVQARVRTRTAPAGAESDKTRKFREVGEPRVNRAIKSIQLLGNLSNKSVYDPTPEDVTKMLKALRGAVQELEDRFSKGKKKTDTFTFVKGA